MLNEGRSWNKKKHKKKNIYKAKNINSNEHNKYFWKEVTNLGLRIQQNKKQNVWEPVIKFVSRELYVSKSFIYLRLKMNLSAPDD